MCQTYPKKLPKETYTCYKVVVRKKIGGKLEYRSPYMNCKYEVSKTYEVKRGGEPGGQAVYDTLLSWVQEYGHWNYIGKKAFHSFKFLDDAKEFCLSSRKNCYILKCEIPKDAAYVFEGDFAYLPSSSGFTRVVKSYASSALKVLEVVSCAGDE